MCSLNDSLFEHFTAAPGIDRLDFEALTKLVSDAVRDAIQASDTTPGSFIFVNLELTPSRLAQFLISASEKERAFKVISTQSQASFSNQPIEILWLNEEKQVVSEFWPDDARESLRQLTRALADSVAGRLLDYRVLFADRWITSSVASLAEPYMLKVLNHQSWEEAWQGLDLLFALKERSPYLSYAIPYRALDPSVCSAVIIEERLSIISLSEAIQIRSTSQLLRYLAHAALAAQYLIENNLRLSDICVENIFIDLDRDVGILRDYDGLRLSNAEGIYIHHRGNYPPGRPFLHGPISEADMVHELGSSLNFVLQRSQQKYESLTGLTSAMLSIDPAKRPPIDQVCQTLSDHTRVL